MIENLLITIRKRTIALIALALSLFLFVSACSRQPRYPAPPVRDGKVVIAVSDLAPETPRFYTYEFKNKPISFFVIKMNGGVVSYLDACVTCYPRKLGYAHENGRMACRTCNIQFSIYKLDKGIGGCYPIKLNGQTAGRAYEIPTALLEAEAGKF